MALPAPHGLFPDVGTAARAKMEPKIPQGQAGSEKPRLINGDHDPHLHLCKYANQA